MDPDTLSVLIVAAGGRAADLAAAVRRGGHAVRVAGDSTPDEVGAALPDVILLDLGRPDAGAYDLAARLKRPGWPRRPLVVGVSGPADPTARDRAAAAGIDLHVAGPDSASLLGLLARYARLLHLAGAPR